MVAVTRAEFRTKTTFASMPIEIRYLIVDCFESWADFLAFRHVERVNLSINYEATAFKVVSTTIHTRNIEEFGLDLEDGARGDTDVFNNFQLLVGFRQPQPDSTSTMYPSEWGIACWMRNINVIIVKLQKMTPDSFTSLFQSVEKGLDSSLWHPKSFYNFLIVEKRRYAEWIQHLQQGGQLFLWDLASAIAVLFGNAKYHGPYAVYTPRRRADDVVHMDVLDPVGLVFLEKSRVHQFLFFQLYVLFVKILNLCKHQCDGIDQSRTLEIRNLKGKLQETWCNVTRMGETFRIFENCWTAGDSN